MNEINPNDIPNRSDLLDPTDCNLIAVDFYANWYYGYFRRGNESYEDFVESGEFWRIMEAMEKSNLIFLFDIPYCYEGEWYQL